MLESMCVPLYPVVDLKIQGNVSLLLKEAALT